MSMSAKLILLAPKTGNESRLTFVYGSMVKPISASLKLFALAEPPEHPETYTFTFVMMILASSKISKS